MSLLTCATQHGGECRIRKWPVEPTSGPNQEPRSPNVELIGCQSVRQRSSFLSLRTVVRTVLPFSVGIRCGALDSMGGEQRARKASHDRCEVERLETSSTCAATLLIAAWAAALASVAFLLSNPCSIFTRSALARATSLA
jgi:hypothetical protein